MHARVPRTRGRDLAIWVRHLANFGPLLIISTIACVLAANRVEASTPLRLIYGLVVGLNVLVLAMASWSALLGTVVRVAEPFGLGPAGLAMRPPTGRARTAVLIAIHEEDAARVFATAHAIADDASREPLGTLEVFILSDTRSAHGIAGEEDMLAKAARIGGDRRPSYRRRAANVGRKAGNIADFVRRWGAAYDFMVVLDADSLMTGACIGRLIGAMEANPRAGLIQAMCYPVGRSTRFARFQQFDARLVGPLFQRGVALWQGPHGNFWGHNAIVRTAAFAASCGLPVLPGRPPLGGEILSHDTVEAALMLRAGHEVWMLAAGPDGRPDGSWEETPTNLLDHLERDRRWLRGNLQHLAVLSMDRLKLASLYHLVRGLTHFLYAPMVVAWLALYAWLDRSVAPDALLLLVAALLLAPRLLGLATALADRREIDGFGGSAKLVISALLDQAIVALLYPSVLVTHLVGLAGLIGGSETRWDLQSRSERSLRWSEAARRLGPALGIAVVAVGAVAPFAPLPAALFMPGLVAGIPLAVLTSRPGGSVRIFATPEDDKVHPLRVQRDRTEQLLRDSDAIVCDMPLPLPPSNGLPMPVQRLGRRRPIK